MTNEVTAHKGSLPVVPEKFRNRNAQEEARKLGAGISSGYPIIRIRGSKWWLSVGKDEEYRVPPTTIVVDGKKKVVDLIDVVILRTPDFASRAYYKGYKGDRSKGERPICSSLQGIVPDPGVEKRQHPTCAGCPRNETYTNDKGMKVRDCSNGKRLAVLPWPTWTQPLLGKPILRPALLRVPGASLKPLRDYAEHLGRLGVSFYGLVTRITFEEGKEFPKMIFDYNSDIKIDEKSADVIDELRELSDALVITGESAGTLREVAGTEAEEEEEYQTPPAQQEPPAAVNLADLVAASKRDEEGK